MVGLVLVFIVVAFLPVCLGGFVVVVVIVAAVCFISVLFLFLHCFCVSNTESIFMSLIN